jgi:putative membrane protein
MESRKSPGKLRALESVVGQKKTNGRQRSVLKGALAGLVGGIVGSGAKTVAEKIFPPRLAEQTAPPALMAENLMGRPLSDGEKRIAAGGIHWTFGAVAGAVYGAAVELEPKAAAWQGAAFGLALNKLTHDSLLPKMGLAEPTIRQRTQERQSEWVSHAVYGVVTDVVRRLVRRGL